MPKLFNYLRYENFLNCDTNSSLLGYCETNKDKFKNAKVSKNGITLESDNKFRICLINLDLGKFEEIFKNEILEKFENFCQELKIKSFDIKDIELQIAAHGDGAFFKPHIDTHTKVENTSKNRVISAVYYFFNEPKQFDGGELLLHPFNFMEGTDEPVTLTPLNNSLVIFPSFGMHEVLPVTCPNVEFKNWRFAINCWINKM